MNTVNFFLFGFIFLLLVSKWDKQKEESTHEACRETGKLKHFSFLHKTHFLLFDFYWIMHSGRQNFRGEIARRTFLSTRCETFLHCVGCVCVIFSQGNRRWFNTLFVNGLGTVQAFRHRESRRLFGVPKLESVQWQDVRNSRQEVSQRSNSRWRNLRKFPAWLRNGVNKSLS